MRHIKVYTDAIHEEIEGAKEYVEQVAWIKQMLAM